MSDFSRAIATIGVWGSLFGMVWTMHGDGLSWYLVMTIVFLCYFAACTTEKIWAVPAVPCCDDTDTVVDCGCEECETDEHPMDH